MSCIDRWVAAAASGQIGRRGLVWLIEKVEPNRFSDGRLDRSYPFRVWGYIIDGIVGADPATFRVERFEWRVPSITDDPAYVFTGDAVISLMEQLTEGQPCPTLT